MPFARPTLSELRAQTASDIQSALPGSDPLLRFSNLGIISAVQAGAAHAGYGYLDWIAKMAVPFTATSEFLEAWAALKDVTRAPAAAASGQITFTGNPGTVIPSGTQVARGDGYLYATTALATVAGGGTIAAAGSAVLASDGSVSGAAGDCDVGTLVTLVSAIAGVQSGATVTTAFIGGTDPETDDSLRNRMLQVFQDPPQGGAEGDYKKWAREVAGVTRAWVLRNHMGTGTVVVFTMFDQAEVAHGGFPQGANGVATAEARSATKATGDQLAVAEYIWSRQPVTALVYSVAPAANSVNFTITGLSAASSDTKDAVKAAIDEVFFREGSVSATTSTVNLQDVEAAITSVPATSGFVITVPGANIVSGAGQLPVRGTVTFA